MSYNLFLLLLLFQIKMPQIFENKYLHGHTLLFFLGKYLESGIHVSYSKYIFTLRNCQIVSQSTYNILHSHEHFIRLSFAPHFHQNLFLLVFLILFILGVTYWYLTVVLIYIPLITIDIEYFLYVY